MVTIAPERTHIDWRSIVGELRARGLTQSAIAGRLSVGRATLYGWTDDGAEPRFGDGVRLLALWCRYTGREAAEAPRRY